MFFFSVPVEEEVDCVLDDVLSVLLLLSLVSGLLFLVFDLFADFFLFQVDLDS